MRKPDLWKMLLLNGRINIEKLGVPDDKINAVMSMNTRVREFFGWKLGLDIVTAYRKGDKNSFHKLISDFFSSSDDTFGAIDIEALMDMIPGNKTIKKDGLMQKIKDFVETMQMNSEGIRYIQAWLKNFLSLLGAWKNK